MACANKVIGVIQAEFDGTNLDFIGGSVTITYGGLMGDGEIMTDGGKYYSTSKITPGSAEGDLPVTGDFSIDDFRGRCGLLTLLSDNGLSYIIRNATPVGDISTKTGEGKVTIKWMGDPVEEI